MCVCVRVVVEGCFGEVSRMRGEGYGGHGDAVSRTLVDVVDKVHEAQLRW